MSIIGTVHEDVTTDVLGNIGPWQWLITLMSTILMMPNLFNHHEYAFLLKPSKEIVCELSEHNKILNRSLCFAILINNGTEEESKCKRWNIKIMWLFWIKKTWLVFCDPKVELLSVAMICRLGSIFGCVIFGLVSDGFGRKMAMKISILTELVFRFILIFCDSEGWYRLFVFLRSLFGSGNIYMGLILISEVASNKWRSCLITIVTFPRLLSLMWIVPIANFSPNLETYSFICCVFSIFITILLRWTPESPQWLLHNRKISVAEKVIFRAAKRNGIKLCNDFKIRPIDHRAYSNLDESRTCMTALSTYNIRVILLVSLVFWNLYFFLWYSLFTILYSHQGVDNRILKLLSSVSIYGCLTIFLSKKLKLRHLLQFNVLVTGTFTTILMILPHKNDTISIMSSIALISGIIGHGITLSITPRILAIRLRATVLGCCHATGQLGAIIGCLIIIFHTADNVITIIVEAGVTLFLAALCFVFPDVDNRELPDIMEDMDYFTELSKPLRWAIQKTDSPSLEEVEMRVHSFESHDILALRVHSQERIPARPIVYLRIWKVFINCIFQMVPRIKV